MTKMIYKILGLLIVISFMGCADNTELKVISDIKSNPENYTNLIETVNKCDLSRFSYHQNISREYFPKILVESINKTVLKGKVKYLSISKEPDCDRINVVLQSDNLYLMYKPCAKDFPLPGSYKEEGLIETWGINSNWIIWRNHDYVF